MPPFLRIQWRSKSVKEKYEPMFRAAQNIYRTLEFHTVLEGFRSVTTEHVPHHQFDVVQQNHIRNGLVFLPLQKVGSYEGFASSHPPVVPGKPWSYYGVVADSIEHAEEFAHASEVGDHVALGRLLGYPECCLQAFKEKWVDQRITDTTWQQALSSPADNIRTQDNNLIRLKDVPWESNNFLRSYAVGPIFHNKCSIHCEDTLSIAKRWIDLAQTMKLEGLKEMEMFNRMPMEWDAYKGIAYIKTPLFKISTSTVACTERYQVQLEGTYFPEEGGKGLDYPWTEELVTMSRNGNQLIYS
jgi:hypothetical protein